MDLAMKAPDVRQAAKTCDIGRALGGKSYSGISDSMPPRGSGCARRFSSTAPRESMDGRGALRLSRQLQPGKRSSWSLSRRQAANLKAAARHAVELGLPLNRFVTIDWEAAGVVDCTRATGRFLKCAGDWLRRRGGHIAYLWVQEGGSRVGQHVHMLVHVPADLARRFSELQRGWLKGCGAEFRRGLIKSRPVGSSYRAALCPEQHAYGENLRRVLGYLLKEADRDGHPSARRSLVQGKRCAISQNIGPRARAVAAAGSAELP